MMKPESPCDAGHLVFLVVYYFGFSILFPHMMILTVTDFWNYKVGNYNVQIILNRFDVSV